MVNVNLEVFKEPRGFIKLIQLLFVIISFASICHFSGETNFKIKNETVSIKYFYPFDLTENIKIANHSINMTDSYKSTSQFSVFVGVMSFLYCIAALLIYVLMDDFLYQDPKMKKIDFVFEAVLAFLWLVVSIAWSDVTVKLKYSVEKGFCDLVKKSKLDCTVESESPFAGTYVGIIASFTSFALMASGLWFLWKETTWFGGNDSRNVESNYATSEPTPTEYPQTAPTGDTGAAQYY